MLSELWFHMVFMVVEIPGHCLSLTYKKYIPLVSDSAATNCGWFPTGPTSGSTVTKSSTSDGNAQKVNSGPKLNPMTSYQTMGPPPPNMATFDGKSEWNPYLVQFNIIANRYYWNIEQRLERLVESLRH